MRSTLALLSICLSIFFSPARCVAADIGSLLNNVTRRNIKTISVSQLAVLLKKDSHVVVLDANPHDPDQGAIYGVIPGAYVLSEHFLYRGPANLVVYRGVKYDPATELPKDKSTKLVFYCYNFL